MNKLRRPSPAELDQMSHAEKDALILKVFDLALWEHSTPFQRREKSC